MMNAMLDEHKLRICQKFSVKFDILHSANCSLVVTNVGELLSIGSCEAISLLAHHLVVGRKVRFAGGRCRETARVYLFIAAF